MGIGGDITVTGRVDDRRQSEDLMALTGGRRVKETVFQLYDIITALNR